MIVFYIIAESIKHYTWIVNKLCDNEIICKDKFKPIYLHKEKRLIGKSEKTIVLQTILSYTSCNYEKIEMDMKIIGIKPLLIDSDNLNLKEIKEFLTKNI